MCETETGSYTSQGYPRNYICVKKLDMKDLAHSKCLVILSSSSNIKYCYELSILALNSSV